jgi:hypothetical protein
MSKLNSKQALAAAVKYIKADHWLGVWLKDSEARVDVARGGFASQAGLDVIRWHDGPDGLEERFTRRNAEGVIALANTGNQIAHEALCLVAKHLTVRGKALPLQLQYYVVGAAIELKKGGKGKRLHVFNDLRDGAIFHALEVVITFGFNATKNAGHKEGVESACSIVSQALGKCGAALSESQVTNIMNLQLKGWTKAGVILAPVWKEHLKSKSARSVRRRRGTGGSRKRAA